LKGAAHAARARTLTKASWSLVELYRSAQFLRQNVFDPDQCDIIDLRVSF
jgi:hypothetical protein